MKIQFWSCCLLIFLLSCSKTPSSSDMKIIPIEMLTSSSNKEFNGKKIHNKSEEFLVTNYILDDSTEIILDAFLCAKIDSYRIVYDSYIAAFYKESKKTNLNSIEEYPRIIDQYSRNHDSVGSYTWQKKRNLHKYIFKKQSWFQQWYHPRNELERLEEVVCK